jgi:hypothetical protein
LHIRYEKRKEDEVSSSYKHSVSFAIDQEDFLLFFTAESSGLNLSFSCSIGVPSI